MTVLQQPKSPAVTAPPSSRGKSVALVAGIVLIVGLAVAGVGGFFAYNWWTGKIEVASNGSSGANGTAGNTEANTTTGEFGRYWLEVLPSGLVAEPMRVAGAVPLTSGQAFKFHFELKQDGYLYIVGPGKNSKPTAFLTEKPAAVSGLDSNQVSKGTDFSFPSGIEKWLELDKKAGIEDYTIIFTPVKLSSPEFFTEQATGEPLSETEQSEFAGFVAQHKRTEPVTELNDKNGSAPFVTIKIPGVRDVESPVIFGVRIQHN
jgi:hypothetical protein